MIKTVDSEVVGNEVMPSYTVEILCSNCSHDVSEAELTTQRCDRCGASLGVPQQNVAITLTSLSSGGSASL